MDLLISMAALVLAITWILKPPKTVAPAREAGRTQRRLLLVFLIVLASAGLAFRLLGFSGSLWLDEFGTLWVVESGLKETWERALAFQGQSPLYYLLTWAPVRLLGESEAVLRIPAFICGVAAMWVIYKLGQEVSGTATGAVAAALAWFSYPMVEASANARPYSLVILAAATMVLGFVRAVDRKSTRLNSSHIQKSRMPSSA